MNTKLTFLGAAQTVTGSKYLLQLNNRKILIDCGLFQGLKELRLRNWEPFTVETSQIEAVVLTHAHLDHSGYLPILVRAGFKGPIYATPATRDLCEILLRDSGRIQEEDARRANKHHYSKHAPALPLYTEQEAIESLKQFKTLDYESECDLGQGVNFRFSPAGHILGSAIVTFHAGDQTIVFSGDLGRSSDFMMKPAATVSKADYLILESTYGDRRHSSEDAALELARVVTETVKRGGVVVIPSFAVGRTQTILYLLNQLRESNSIPPIHVYLDSPMAQDATDLLLKYANQHKLSPEECAKVGRAAIYVQSAEESKRLNADPSPKVIIAGSGMAEGGRVLHHLKFYGPSEKNAIIFTGFQAPMTRGDRILKGADEIKIFGERVPIRAPAEILDSLSSHADYEEILTWLQGLKAAPKTIFLTHGEKDAAEALKERIEKQYGWKVIIPGYKETFSLS